MRPRHPRASHFARTGLFEGLTRFSDLERRIVSLPTDKGRGDAFEVFAEAYLAIQKQSRAEEVWPFAALPEKLKQTLIPGPSREEGADGVSPAIPSTLQSAGAC